MDPSLFIIWSPNIRLFSTYLLLFISSLISPSFPCSVVFSSLLILHYIVWRVACIDVSSLSICTASITTESLLIENSELRSLRIEIYIMGFCFASFVISLYTTKCCRLSSNYFLWRCWYIYICMLLIGCLSFCWLFEILGSGDELIIVLKDFLDVKLSWFNSWTK